MQNKIKRFQSLGSFGPDVHGSKKYSNLSRSWASQYKFQTRFALGGRGVHSLSFGVCTATAGRRVGKGWPGVEDGGTGGCIRGDEEGGVVAPPSRERRRRRMRLCRGNRASCKSLLLYGRSCWLDRSITFGRPIAHPPAIDPPPRTSGGRLINCDRALRPEARDEAGACTRLRSG